mgnify:CR=1 FL=1
MRFAIAALMLIISTSAFAQQQPLDPAFLHRAISALQAQRNQSMDTAAVSEARAAGLADELAKAQARIKELEKKPEEKK